MKECIGKHSEFIKQNASNWMACINCEDKDDCTAESCIRLNKNPADDDCKECNGNCKRDIVCTMLMKENEDYRSRCRNCELKAKCEKPEGCFGAWDKKECKKDDNPACTHFDRCVKYQRRLKIRKIINDRAYQKGKMEIDIKHDIGKRYLKSKTSDFNLSMTYPIYQSIKAKNNAFIYGTAGTGKTHLSVGLYKNFYKYVSLEHNKTGFVKSNSLLIEIKDTFRNDSTLSETDIIEKYSRYDYLFIDDVGSEKITDWVLSVWYEIIDARYSEEKPTIFTSNLTPEQIFSVYGERLASRILSGIMFEIKGKDRRLQ